MVFVPSCGCCSPCAEGRPALCEPAAKANNAGEMLGGGRRIARGGAAVHHHLGVSAFAEHAVVSRRSLVKVPKDLPLVEAALFGCAVLTGVGAVANTARIAPGSSVAVIGLGGVGSLRCSARSHAVHRASSPSTSNPRSSRRRSSSARATA
jgi:alcohol dehydrogenase